MAYDCVGLIFFVVIFLVRSTNFVKRFFEVVVYLCISRNRSLDRGEATENSIGTRLSYKGIVFYREDANMVKIWS